MYAAQMILRCCINLNAEPAPSTRFLVANESLLGQTVRWVIFEGMLLEFGSRNLVSSLEGSQGRYFVLRFHVIFEIKFVLVMLFGPILLRVRIQIEQ